MNAEARPHLSSPDIPLRRVALVTGASRGIGAACALGLAKAGMDVAVAYRTDKARAVRVTAEIAAMRGKAVALAADISDPRAIETLFEGVISAFGRIDVLVSNAGIASLTPLPRVTLEEWESVMNTNVRSTALLAQLVIPGMIRQSWGRIITISSQAGISGGVFVGLPYATSKGALIAMTKSLAKITADSGVTVNCIAPGLIDTDMVAAFPGDSVRGMIASIPMKRLGQSAEVAAAVEFLASPGASYITGAVIPIDGGLLINQQ